MNTELASNQSIVGRLFERADTLDSEAHELECYVARLRQRSRQLARVASILDEDESLTLCDECEGEGVISVDNGLGPHRTTCCACERGVVKKS